MPKFVIVDGNAIVHRAFHALPPMTNKDGLVLNAVYGFISILLRTVKEIAPKYLAVTFDLKAPTFRHKEYKEYKAKRVKQPQELYDQIDLARNFLRAAKIPVFEKEGFEADDLIATLTALAVIYAKNKKERVENIIVTGDMDTLQLVDENTKVYTMKKGINDIAVYDIAAVKERYGLLPEQMVDYKSLRGDPSDNIPGVKGIGEKTASELLQKFGSVAELYVKLKKGEDIGFSKSVVAKLLTGEKDAEFGRHLVELVKDAPIDFDLETCRLDGFVNEDAKVMLRAWEFFSLLKRLEKFAAADESADKREAREAKENVVKLSVKKLKIIEVKTKKEVVELNKEIKKSRRTAIYLSDDEGGGLKAKLFGLVLTLNGSEVYYISSNLIGVLSFLAETEIICQDAKRVLEICERYNLILPNNFTDLMLLDYLLDHGTRSHGFPNLVLRYLGKESSASQSNLFGADVKNLAENCLYLWQMSAILKKELTEKGFENLYKKMEMPLISVLSKMEKNGIKIDVYYLKEMASSLKKKEKELTKKIYNLAGEEFNIASPLQLKEILFDKLNIPIIGIKRGKTGISTAASELEKMRGMHPIIEFIFEYRELVKLQNTYVDVLPTLVGAGDRARTTFNQAVTATGRLSSSNPNLQNIPNKSELGREIRRAFIAESGFKLLSLDYSQIELRIIASLANDVEMIKIFQEGGDIHQMTAAKVNGVLLEQVTDEMRNGAKAINFGIIYGMGPHSLAQSIGVSFVEARDFIVRYFSVFKNVKIFLDETRALARAQGYVETLLGRRRYLLDISSNMPQARAAAERMALNAPIQGTAADLIKLAMIEVDNLLAKKYGDDEARMLLQVHDELVFEARKDLVEKLAKEAGLIMENVLKLRVPIKVDAKVGDNWGEMEEIRI